MNTTVALFLAAILTLAVLIAGLIVRGHLVIQARRRPAPRTVTPKEPTP